MQVLSSRNNINEIRVVITLAALLLSAGVIYYSLALLSHGVKFTQYTESSPGNPPIYLGTQYLTDPAAAIPLASAVLIGVGVLSQHLHFVWVGQLTLTLFTAAFLFGINGELLPAAMLLLILLVILQFVHRIYNLLPRRFP